MNTVFQKWGNKFLVTKLQQVLKKSIDHKLYRSTVHCVTCSSLKATCGLRNTNVILNESLSIYHDQQAKRLFSLSRNRCWKCNAVLTERDLVCISCGCVQEPKHTLNYFEIFKETPQFDLDIRNLKIKFRRLQTLLHPDKFATRSDKEKEFSAEQSSLVNKAHQTLLCPIERGLYLLELYSKPLEEDGDTLPPEFLVEVMEVNEKLEGIKCCDALETIRHVNDAKLQLLYSDVSLAFKEKNIDKAKESLKKLKYFINIDDKIKKLEEELGVIRDD